MISPDMTLGELVAEKPARAELFERLRLDYCCHGGQTLAEACSASGLDLGQVRASLLAPDSGGGEFGVCSSTDWRQARLTQLVEHIVSVHHDGLRQSLPRVEQLLATVVRVHGEHDLELHSLQHEFRLLRGELQPHLDTEETQLFPACVKLEEGGSAVDAAMLAEHEGEHETVGQRLVILRQLGLGYDTSRALCSTHRELLRALADLERDLHQHIHEENNILIPRARGLGAHAAADPELPRCCQAWIAEQARGWAH